MVGGGLDTTRSAAVHAHFTSELSERTEGLNRVPRIAVVLFDHDGSGAHFLPFYADPIRSRIDCLIVEIFVRPGRSVDPALFADVDAIVVGGGPTPAYLKGLEGAANEIRLAVGSGVPYLGFSAGAMIAPDSALIGGYRIHSTEVCPAEWSEGLEELTFHPGLGLIPFAVDVHTAQGGTLGRAVAAVHHGVVDSVMAIDEDTALVVDSADQRKTKVIGSGNCWTIIKCGGKTMVSMTGS